MYLSVSEAATILNHTAAAKKREAGHSITPADSVKIKNEKDGSMSPVRESECPYVINMDFTNWRRSKELRGRSSGGRHGSKTIYQRGHNNIHDAIIKIQEKKKYIINLKNTQLQQSKCSSLIFYQEHNSLQIFSGKKKKGNKNDLSCCGL